MRKSICLMAIAIASVALTACVKEPAFLGEVSFPDNVEGNQIVLDAWAGNFSVEINTEGDWRIESSDFVTVKPVEGKGDASIKVYLEDNEEEHRLKGNITIVFPGHEEQNKVLAIEQKWTGEYDENAEVLGTSNKIYAVGYGYDTSKGLYASKKCLKAQIFNTGQLIDEGIETTDGLDMHATLSTITGNSITELSNKLTAKASGSGGIGKFKAEANASFTMDYTDNSNHEYAINYLEATLTTASFDLPIEDLRTEEYMTTKAYNAINGLNASYPSTEEGFKALIRAYGTHVVMTARLGGRVRQSLDVDITDITESYDLNVFAKASYEGVLAKAEGSVNDDFHQTYKKHKSEMRINVEALGGDTKLAKALVAKDGFTEANYLAWFNSVDGTNLTLMGFDDDSLLPLYELVDRPEYPERYEALKKYMTGGQIDKDFQDNSTYDTGTVTAFPVPMFDPSWNGSSLVKDIMLNGQQVGIVCEEYIPIINQEKRVVVVYPIIGSKVRYNMGFFIGDKDHKPARVAWNGTDTNISEYSELDFGQAAIIYLRGASITSSPAEGAEVRQGQVQQQFASAMGHGWQTEYPVVKIFNQLWMRKNFQADKYTTGGSINCKYDWDNTAFYSYEEASNQNFAPSGWRVTSKNDFINIKGLLEAKGVTRISPAKAFFPDKNGGVLGFYETFSGGWWDNKIQGAGAYGMYGCLNSKRQMESVCMIQNNQVFDPAGQTRWDNDCRYPVRLVKNLY